MNSERHNPEEHSFPPAGRVRNADGTVDRGGVWRVAGTNFDIKEDGTATEYVTLLKEQGDRLVHKRIPAERYHGWQSEPLRQETEEQFTAREMRIFAPLTPEMGVRAEVTEESEANALNLLETTLERDSTVKRILSEYAQDGVDEKQLLELLRTDPELRCKLGRHFMDKIPSLSYLPERVKANDPRNEKVPDCLGYEPMKSHEYVSVLALSMIDGTFKAPKHDDIYRNEFGEAVQGQHRAAAEIVLTTYNY